MSETKILERCPKCGQAVRLEVTWFGITNVIPCYCKCENEAFGSNCCHDEPEALTRKKR